MDICLLTICLDLFIWRPAGWRVFYFVRLWRMKFIALPNGRLVNLEAILYIERAPGAPTGANAIEVIFAREGRLQLHGDAAVAIVEAVGKVSGLDVSKVLA